MRDSFLLGANVRDMPVGETTTPPVGFIGVGLFGRSLIALVAAAVLAPPALAADSVYWANSINPGPIRTGPLTGGGGSNLFGGESYPTGVVLDPAHGRIYWTAEGSGVIRGANLDGSGAATDLFTDSGDPNGLAIDAATGKLYWADFGSNTIPNTIREGSVNGGAASTLFTEPLGSGPEGVAVDPAAGKIYWTDETSGKIRVGPITGGTGSDVVSTTESEPTGLAVDPAAGKIYWSDLNTGNIRVANLTGGGAPGNLFQSEATPEGIAIDSAAGKIYWTDVGPGKIRVGNLGGGGATDLFGSEVGPNFVALLRAPAGTGVPEVLGGGRIGQSLTCSPGTWATDVPASFLYRAPYTFGYQWLVNGSTITRATATTYTPTRPGNYECQANATNQAGTSSQTSSPVAVNPGAPTALTVSPKKFKLAGRRVKGKCVKTTAKNRNDPTCKRPIKLKITYKLTAAAAVTFTLTRNTSGREVKGKCVKQTKKNAKRKKCTRAINVPESITQAGKTGRNTFTFKRKKLAPGSYTLTATTLSGSKTARFRVVS